MFMKPFVFHDRGGLGSVLNKMFCMLFSDYLANGIFYSEIKMGGVINNRGLVNSKGHNLYPDILKVKPENFRSIVVKRNLKLSIDYFGLRDFPALLEDPATMILLDTYFNFSDAVVFRSEKIMRDFGVLPLETLFVWARKTDKVKECEMPDVQAYTEMIRKNGLGKYRVILQTDDVSVLDDFRKAGIVFQTLDVLPLVSGERGFHLTDGCLSEDAFYNKFGMSKVEYNIRFMALVRIASLSEAVLLYPGNLQCFIPMMKRSLKNCFVLSGDMKQKKEILPARKIFLPGEEFIKVVYIGEFSDSIFLTALLEATVPPNMDIIFVGAQPTADPILFESLMRQAEARPNIHYFGIVADQEYSDLLFSADAVILSPVNMRNKTLVIDALSLGCVLIGIDTLNIFKNDDIHSGDTKESIGRALSGLALRFSTFSKN